MYYMKYSLDIKVGFKKCHEMETENCVTAIRVIITVCVKTTVYKAGLSTVGDLYNLLTKIITKYPVLTTFKILKITKKNISNFL